MTNTLRDMVVWILTKSDLYVCMMISQYLCHTWELHHYVYAGILHRRLSWFSIILFSREWSLLKMDKIKTQRNNKMYRYLLHWKLLIVYSSSRGILSLAAVNSFIENNNNPFGISNIGLSRIKNLCCEPDDTCSSWKIEKYAIPIPLFALIG